MSVKEFDSQKLSLRSELHIARKALHVGGGLFLLFIYQFFNLSELQFSYLLFSCFIIAFILDFCRIKLKGFNNFSLSQLGAVMREDEKNSFSGLPFYTLGLGVVFCFFQKEIALLSALFLIFSDPTSSLVGIRFGKIKTFGGKTLEGSVAGLIVCYILTTVAILNFTDNLLEIIFFSLGAGLIGSISELLSIFIDDNFTIPVASAIGLTFLNYVFTIF